MVNIRSQGIDIDYYNDPSPENISIHDESTSGIGNWRREGITPPPESRQHSKSFRFYFRHYSHHAILRMSLIQLFFDYFTTGLYQERSHYRDQQGAECANVSSIVYKVGWLLDIYGMLGWN